MKFNRTFLFLIITLSLYSCDSSNTAIQYLEGTENECEKGYDTFSSWQADNYYNLLKKYDIREVNFDTETIYTIEDLGLVISEILDSTHSIEYEITKEYHDSKENKYKTVFLIENKEYVFETSSLGDYIDFDKNYQLLKDIAKNTKSDCTFEIPWFPDDQSMSIVFAPKETLEKAINEGFPLTIEGQEWKWSNTYIWDDVVEMKTDIEKPIEQNKFRYQMVKTVNQLISSGINIKPITLNRVYLTCLYKSDRIRVIVDGNSFLHSSCQVNRNSIISNNEFWNVIFQYMLAENYGNNSLELTLKNGVTKIISVEDLKLKITKAQQGV